MKDFISVIQELYAAGITLGFQTNWDAHFDVWLEDNYSGRKVQATFTMDELSAAERWLEEMAVVHFPSLYPRSATALSRSGPLMAMISSDGASVEPARYQRGLAGTGRAS